MSNPYDFPEVWGDIQLSGMSLGTVVSVDGCERPYEWQVQKGQGSKGATSVYKGEGIAESIKVVVAMPTQEDFAYAATLRKYIAPAKGKKPTSFAVGNPIFNWNEINLVAIKTIGFPKPSGKGGWTLEYTFIETQPSASVQTGTSKGTQWMQSNGPTPQDAADAEIAELVKKAQAS